MSQMETAMHDHDSSSGQGHHSMSALAYAHIPHNQACVYNVHNWVSRWPCPKYKRSSLVHGRGVCKQGSDGPPWAGYHSMAVIVLTDHSAGMGISC